MPDTAESLSEREEKLWRQFYEMQVQFWRRLSQQLQSETGLSEPDYTVLTALLDAPGGRMRPYELGEFIDYEKSRLHHHLNRMIDRGLLERESCPGSVRAAIIVLTDAGREAVMAAIPRRASHVRRLLIDVLTATEKEALEKISGAVLDNIRTNPFPEDTEGGACA